MCMFRRRRTVTTTITIDFKNELVSCVFILYSWCCCGGVNVKKKKGRKGEN